MGSKKKYLMSQMGSTTNCFNFYCLLFTCLFLFLAMGVSSNGTVQNILTKMVTSSDKPEYKDINITANYESDPNYDPEGLDWLYSITKKFMNLILEEAIPDDVITINGDNKIDVNLDGHVSDILNQYAYVVAICVVLLVFALVMLLAGLCFTCRCYCGRTSHNEKNNNTKKICLITLLIICGVVITFGGVCAVLANSRLHDGVHEFPEGLRKAIKDAKTFMTTTIDQINILLGDNFQEFTVWISAVIDDCSTNVQNGVDEIANKMSVDEIFKIADKFVVISDDIKQIMTITKKTKRLATSLRTVQHDLTDTLASCTTPECNSLKEIVDKLEIPNVNTDSLFTILDEVLKIPDKLTAAKDQFNGIKSKIKTTVNSGKETVNTKITEAGNTIKENVDKIASEIKKLEDNLPDTDNTGDDSSTLNEVQNYVDTYNPYMFFVGLAICCVLFSIVALLAVGMICDFGRNNFLNKGSRLSLLCGTSLMFYFTIVIAAVSLIYFLMGIAVQQAVCKSLREPSQSRFFQLLDEFDLGKYGLDIKVSVILSSIRKDESAYNAFDLKSQFDLDKIDKYLDQFKDALKGLKDFADKIDLKHFEMMSADQMKTLKAIEEPKFSIVTDFFNKLEQHITSVVIDGILTSLDALIKIVDETLKANLEIFKKNLDDEKEEIDKLPQSIADVEKVIDKLTEDIKLGAESFKIGKDNLIDMIDEAQTFLQSEGPTKITEIMNSLTDETFSVSKGYLDQVKNKTRDEVGKCGPIGNVLDATLVSLCDKVALQMNTFWFVLLWTMLFFLPTVVVSTKLANIYKSQASHKPNPDSNIRTQRTDRDVNDIRLDRWEQYSGSPQPHSSRTPEEYSRPPPYFFEEEPESSKLGTSKQIYDEMDELR